MNNPELTYANRILDLEAEIAKLKASAIFTVKSFAEKDGTFRGIVVNADERPVIWTPRTFKKPEQAERNARGIFRRAIFECTHNWSFAGDEHAETTEFGGIEYVSHSDCDKCGLRRWEINDHSMFDYSDHRRF